MPITTIPCDIANYLDSDEMIQEYFSQVLEGGDSEEIVRAMGHIARARGMEDHPTTTDSGSDGLRKTFDTVFTAMRSLGLRFASPGSIDAAG